MRRDPEHVVGVHHGARHVHPDRVGQLVLGDIVAHRRGLLLDADPQEDQPFGPMPLVRVSQVGRLVLAWRTPRGPEIDPDRMALQVGHGDGVPVNVGQADGPARIGGAYEVRCDLPDLQSLCLGAHSIERGLRGGGGARPGGAERLRDREQHDEHNRDDRIEDEEMADREGSDDLSTQPWGWHLGGSADDLGGVIDRGVADGRVRILAHTTHSVVVPA